MNEQQFSVDVAAAAVTIAEAFRRVLQTEIAKARAELRAELAAVQAPRPQRCTVSEAAEQLGCSVRHVHRLCSIGRLKRTKIGARVYISQKSIDRVLTEETE